MKGEFTFCGVDIAELGLEYVPEKKDTYVYAGGKYKVDSDTFDGHHGGYYYGTTVQPKTFTLRCYYEDKHIDYGIMTRIEQVFQRGRTGKLCFKRRPWVYYIATCTGIDLTNMTSIKNGFVTITLTAYYPFGRSEKLYYEQPDKWIGSMRDNSGLMEKSLTPDTSVIGYTLTEAEDEDETEYAAVQDGYLSPVKIGGRTFVWNQQANIGASTRSKTENGVTFVDNRSGSYSVVTEGAATADTTLYVTDTDCVAGKYYVNGISGGSDTTYYLGNSEGCVTANGSVIYTAASNQGKWRMVVKSGTTIASSIDIWPQIINLTKMFGSGNEPSTAAEFESLFPTGKYAYNEGSLLQMKAKGISITGKNKLSGTIGSYSATNSGTLSNVTINGGEICGRLTATQGGTTRAVFSFASSTICESTGRNLKLVIVRYDNADASVGMSVSYDSASHEHTDGDLIPDTISGNNLYFEVTAKGVYDFHFAAMLTERDAELEEYEKYNSGLVAFSEEAYEIDGYGDGVGESENLLCHDYAKEAWSLVRNVGKVSMAGLAWEEGTAGTMHSFRAAYSGSLGDGEVVSNVEAFCKETDEDVKDGNAAGIYFGDDGYLYAADGVSTSLSAFINAIADCEIVFELAEAEEEDITEAMSEYTLPYVYEGDTFSVKTYAVCGDTVIENNGACNVSNGFAYADKESVSESFASKSFLLYQGGTEYAPAAVVVCGDVKDGLVIKNKTTEQQMKLVAITDALTRDAGCDFVCDSMNGKSYLTDGETQTMAFLYHDSGFLSVAPCCPVVQKVYARTTNGSNLVSFVKAMEDLTGKYININGEWRKITGMKNERCWAIDGLVYKTERFEAKLAEMNEMEAISVGSNVSLTKLQVNYLPTFR